MPTNELRSKHTIELHLTAAGYGSSIKIDGVEIPRVKSVKLEGRAGEITVLTLEILALDGIDVTVETDEIKRQLMTPGGIKIPTKKVQCRARRGDSSDGLDYVRCTLAIDHDLEMGHKWDGEFVADPKDPGR